MKILVAAAVAAILLAASVPAQAGGGHYRGGAHGHGHDGYWLGAAILGGLIVGHLLASASRYPEPAYRPYPATVLRDCQPTTGRGYVNGRPAQFGGTICYDAYRRPHIVRGSAHFIGYLQ